MPKLTPEQKEEDIFVVAYEQDRDGKSRPFLFRRPADERTSHPKGSDSLDSTTKGSTDE